MPRGRRNPPRAVPNTYGRGAGAFGTTPQPTTGRRTGPTEVQVRQSGMNYVWQGQVVIQAFNEVLTTGFQSLAGFAQDYWTNEEWTQDRHPYMTGAERNAGFFIVGQGNRGTVELQVGSEVPYAIYEEFGTSERPGHYPIRNTLDRVAYRFSDAIRAASREAGLI